MKVGRWGQLLNLRGRICLEAKAWEDQVIVVIYRRLWLDLFVASEQKRGWLAAVLVEVFDVEFFFGFGRKDLTLQLLGTVVVPMRELLARVTRMWLLPAMVLLIILHFVQLLDRRLHQVDPNVFVRSNFFVKLRLGTLKLYRMFGGIPGSLWILHGARVSHALSMHYILYFLLLQGWIVLDDRTIFSLLMLFLHSTRGSIVFYHDFVFHGGRILAWEKSDLNRDDFLSRLLLLCPTLFL